MIYRSELLLCDHLEKIVLEYHDKHFEATENTGVTLYSTYKVSFVLSGGITAITSNRIFHTVAGDCLVFRPDEVHFGRILNAGNYRYLDILIPLGYFERLSLQCDDLIALLEHQNGLNLLRPTAKQRERMLEETEVLSEMLQHGEGRATPKLFLETVSLLLLCADIFAGNRIPASEIPVPDCVTQTLQYISQHFGEKITLEDMAKNCYCSVAYLSKCFKHHVGCTVGDHLTERRLLHAERLLRNGKNVTETCFECGFHDCSHFIKTFKRYNGLTPYEYRKAHFKK